MDQARRIRRSRQASATTGRSARIVSPFMPRYKNWEQPEIPEIPQGIEKETAPLPAKRVIGPGTAADITETGGPTGGGKGEGFAKGFLGMTTAQLGGMIGSPLGPAGAIAGGYIGYKASQWLTKKSEESQRELNLGRLGEHTYSGEMTSQAFGGRVNPMSGEFERGAGAEHELRGGAFSGRADPFGRETGTCGGGDIGGYGWGGSEQGF